jgi:chemotaxis protein MotA
MDIASVGGILLAVIGILGGLMLEGGSIAQVTQPTAMIIVLGGTMGAVMLQFPLNIFLAAMKQSLSVFFFRSPKSEAIVLQLVAFAVKARKSGIVSLDAELTTIDDPFLRQTLMLAIDGTEPTAVRQIMQLELENRADSEERIPQVFESAGGFAPTVGIIGAVIGLIQVMQRLDNITAVGRGIAIAFVATIYGVGLANLVFLPTAGKLRIRQQEEQVLKEMILEGVISIQEGMNPRMIEIKLRTFLFDDRKNRGPAGVSG